MSDSHNDDPFAPPPQPPAQGASAEVEQPLVLQQFTLPDIQRLTVDEHADQCPVSHRAAEQRVRGTAISKSLTVIVSS